MNNSAVFFRFKILRSLRASYSFFSTISFCLPNISWKRTEKTNPRPAKSVPSILHLPFESRIEISINFCILWLLSHVFGKSLCIFANSHLALLIFAYFLPNLFAICELCFYFNLHFAKCQAILRNLRKNF